MSPESFEAFFKLVEPYITKKSTKLRNPIPAKVRLAVTLRFLASGETQQSLSWSFRIGRATVSHIVRETCQAIWNVLSPVYLKSPNCKEDWMKISEDFLNFWQFPHCVGAIDGKHVAIECPRKSGTQFYNYKGFFSLVLLAICDAKYCFTFVDIGQFGSGNDSGVLKSCQLDKAFEENTLNLPELEPIDGMDGNIPYFLLGDEIFPLNIWLQRPYPGPLDEEKKIFNYRVSRARRTIENAFRILSARWRIFRSPIRADVKTAELIVQAAVCLHNFLQLTSSAAYTPLGFIDSENDDGSIKEGDWRKIVREGTALSDLPRARGGRRQLEAKELQAALKHYLNSENGMVEWQLEYVRRTGKQG